MLVCVGLHRCWVQIVFVLIATASVTSLSAATLVIKEMPLQLLMDDAEVKKNIEQGLMPLLTRLDAVAQELEQLNLRGKLDKPSQDIVELLQLCDHWQAQLHNNFSCRLGALQRDWDAAALKSELPDRTLLRQKSRHHLKLQWKVDKAGVHFSDAAISEGLQLDLHGLWQGWVLERVAGEIKKIALQQKLVSGDFSLVFGNLTLAVNKSTVIEQQVTLTGLSPISVLLKNQSVVVLDRQQNLRKVSHYPMSRLLVPKEGWPVEFSPSLIVRASTAIDAGVLAQSLMSISVYDALEQVNKMTSVTALAITETGMLFASKDWYGETIASNTPWLAQQIFSIDYEIPALDVAEYRRPYAAIWISDSNGNAIRHLKLLGENRWLRDLRLWWRKFGRADDALVDALAGATRKPGRYRIDWDGRDGQGNKVPQGNYELHLEVVREHGEREAIALPFVLNGQAISAETKGTQEIGLVQLALH
jgi:thiamine biosynthesis lipoprotein